MGDKDQVQAVLVPPLSTEDGPGFLELPRNTIEVAFAEPPAFSLSVEPPPSGFVLDRTKSREIQIPCKIERCAKCIAADVPLVFDIEELPGGLRPVKQELTTNGESAGLTFAASPETLKPGQYRLAFRAKAIVKGREFSETTAAISLRVK
jgi:hypothetical protein